MKKILFVDRDGTLINEPKDYQVDHIDKLEFLQGVVSNLNKIQHQLGYTLVLITNQDGLGTSSFPEEAFWPTHNAMMRMFESEGVHFENVFIDRSFPSLGDSKLDFSAVELATPPTWNVLIVNCVPGSPID